MAETKEPIEKKLTTWDSMKRNPGNLVLVTVVAVIIFVLGLFIGGAASRHDNTRIRGFGTGRSGLGFYSRGGFSGQGPMLGSQNSSNQDRIEGVVTSVNGSNLTVAGDGTTNTVVTNSSTQYSGGSSAAVNDTVIVLGSTTNGTFTATSIDIIT